MEYFTENWLQTAVGIYLLGMVLYGHYRGFLRLAVSMTALVVTLAAVHVAMPYVGTFIRDKTPVYGWIVDNVSDALDIRDNAAPDDGRMSEEQERFIEEMRLPDDLKKLLIENNNGDVYDLLGVDAFAGYIGNYLANVIINFIGFVILFLVIYTALKLLAKALDLVAKLPVLSGMNQLAGALLGGLQGLFFLWLASLPVTAFATASWATAILDQIEASSWLSFLYHYNLISHLALGIVRGIVS